MRRLFWNHAVLSRIGFVRWLLFAAGAFLFTLATPLAAGQLRLEIEPQWSGVPVILNRELPAAVPSLTIDRCDGLLSELSLQRADGTWLESRDWFAFISLAQQRLGATADGLPAEDFKAVRFRVGVNTNLDRANPNEWPAGHALHPDVCGLHWGWQSGYVHLAVEGHWRAAGEPLGGFSYHLAGAMQPMIVEVPVKFSGAQPTTIRLAFDLAGVLAKGEVLKDATSTHSRENDMLALRLKELTSRAFHLVDVRNDLFQSLASTPVAANPAPAGTRPYRLAISERLPKASLPVDNPLTVEGVELGRRLFHETRLSKNDSQSCASCHEQSRAFADGRARSLGAEGQAGRRNAMPLMNLAWADKFFWDGRARSLREQVLMPIQDAHEMNERLDRVVTKLEADERYPGQFAKAFGSPGVTSERAAFALEQFLLTLVSQESKFDRAARKLESLTAPEQRGLELFVTEHDPARSLRGADCFHCHGGNLFSNQQFMNNGLAESGGDRGRMEVTGAAADHAKFKVPSLRNVALTAPYMHDGRFATLEEVVEHYNGPMHQSPTLDPNLAKHPVGGLGLSGEEQAALIAFLKTLTDPQFVTPPNPGTQLSQVP